MTMIRLIPHVVDRRTDNLPDNTALCIASRGKNGRVALNAEIIGGPIEVYACAQGHLSFSSSLPYLLSSILDFILQSFSRSFFSLFSHKCRMTAVIILLTACLML